MTIDRLVVPKGSPWPWWMVALDHETRGSGMMVKFPNGANLEDGSRISAGEVLPERWLYVEGNDLRGARSSVLSCLHGFKLSVKNPPGSSRLFKTRDQETAFLRRVLATHNRDYYGGGHNEYAL